MHSTRGCPPLVLPAALAPTLRGAISTLDVRVVIMVRQMVEGYKTVDRLVVATRDGFFLTNSATGEFSRYVRWEVVEAVHWYPALQVAAFVCSDAFDIVMGALPSGGGGVSGSTSTAGNTSSGATSSSSGNTASSPPTSPRPSTLAPSSFPLGSGGSTTSSPTPAPQPSSSSSSGLPNPIRSIVQRVRSSTVNFGRLARPPVASGGPSPPPHAHTNTTQTYMSIHPMHPTTQQQLQAPAEIISPYTGVSPSATSFAFTDGAAAASYPMISIGDEPPLGDSLCMSSSPTALPFSFTTSQRLPPPGTASFGGRLPLTSSSPATLLEFIEWASALSHSRAYHCIVPSGFSIAQSPTEHLNAWQVYRVKRPAGLTMDPPIEVAPRESLTATEGDLAVAKRRRHEDDSRSAGELRRAALMLGGLHIVGELLSKDWERQNTVEVSPRHEHHVDPTAGLLELPLTSAPPRADAVDDQEELPGVGPLSSSRGTTDDIVGVSPPTDHIDGSGLGEQQRFLPQHDSTSSLDRQVSCRDSEYSDGANSFTGGGGRRRGLTLFCAQDDDSQQCRTVGGGAHRHQLPPCPPPIQPPAAPSNSTPTSAIRDDRRGVVPRSNIARPLSHNDSYHGTNDDDEFVIVDNPGVRVWNSSPPPDMPPDEQAVWWRRHCAALMHENKGLRQEADELRLRLSMLLHETAAPQGGELIGLSSSQRRHRLPF